MSNSLKCLQCGICCIFFDITSLNKKAFEPCQFLNINTGKCNNYKKRPDVCRDFKADEICYLISSLNKEEKLYILSKVYN
jgi:Fe-S-cluster containining protein